MILMDARFEESHPYHDFERMRDHLVDIPSSNVVIPVLWKDEDEISYILTLTHVTSQT